MASLYISEYDETASVSGGQAVQVGKEPSVADQKVTYTSSTASAAFNDKTVFIRVIADATVHLKFGANPTADATDLMLPANKEEYFGVTPGQKVAAYDGTT